MPDFARGYRHRLVAVICSMLVIPGQPSAARPVFASQQSGGSEEQAPKIPNDQLDSLVAPIALYPDPLLAQVLAASTYPLEIMQLQQWLSKNKDLKDKALQDAVSKLPSKLWLRFPMSSSDLPTIFSGQPTWEMPFWHNSLT